MSEKRQTTLTEAEIGIAVAIMNNRLKASAFMDSLDDIQRNIIYNVFSYSYGRTRSVSPTAEQLFPAIAKRFQDEVQKPAAAAYDVPVSGCPSCLWVTGHASDCTRETEPICPTKRKLNVIGEPILLATDIMNVPAFWNSLSSVQKEAVREADAAQQLGQRTTDAFKDDVDLAVWGFVQRKYQLEVVEPSEKRRQETRAKLGEPFHDGFGNVGFKHTDPFAAPATNGDSPKPLWPQTGWSDTDVFEVNYKDEIQVQIDRTQDGEIELRVWQIGDDNPLDTWTMHLPAKTDCFNCGDRCGVDFLDDNRYCVVCTKPYQPEEIELLLNFAKGYARAVSNNAKAIDDVHGDIDEWVTVDGGSEALDIHFMTNDDEASDWFGMLQAWGYRRPIRDGDQKCEDELRLI